MSATMLVIWIVINIQQKLGEDYMCRLWYKEIENSDYFLNGCAAFDKIKLDDVNES